MSRTTKPETETTEEVKTEIVEEVKEEVKNVEESGKETVNKMVVETVEPMAKAIVKPVDPVGPVGKLSAETQRMNAQQFFDTYPHDNKQVVALIITLYGNQIKTVAQWETFYQQMLKKRVS